VTRGPRATSARTVARRSICALAAMCDELLSLIGHHTTDTHAWFASWKTERVGGSPTPWSPAVTRLLYVLLDARRDVWRHVTHERNARDRVMVAAARVLREHRHTEPYPATWCEESYGRHHVAMQRAEMLGTGVAP